MFVTGLVSLFTDLSSEMIVPVLPLFLTAVLHVQAGEIGVIEGIAESTASVLKLFSGWLSDQMGRRKPLMLAGYGFSNLIKPLFAVCTSWGQVLFIRFADRFGKGVRGAPRDALIADAATEADRGRAFGFHRAMDTLGAALGPLTAFAVLAALPGHYRMVFWVSAVPGVIAVLLLLVFLREPRTPAPAHRRRGLPRFGFRALGGRFMGFSLIAALFALGNSSDAFLILRAQDVGMRAELIPLAYFTFNATYAVFAMPAGVLSDRIGRRGVLVLGYLIFAAIYLGFGVVTSPAGVWALFAVYGLYYAATEGIQKAYVADLVPSGQRGMAMGTFNAIIGLAALPASVVAGALWQAFGPLATFGVSAVCALLAAVLLMVFRI
ncbi:MAG: MFS transporter [Alicyclobacillus sp.]|nr:MFS transporter [Alicyclobacillus sp.]